MKGRVLVIDTSVLCCFLKIPGKDTAGSEADRWDYRRIKALLSASAANSIFVLPLATLIETGNHVAQAPERRYELAQELGKIIRKVADAATPWAAFTDQADLWGSEKLNHLSDAWPNLAASKISLGDATIKDVADRYAQAGYSVEIVTGDAGLKAYEPEQRPPQPRRRVKSS